MPNTDATSDRSLHASRASSEVPENGNSGNARRPSAPPRSGRGAKKRGRREELLGALEALVEGDFGVRLGGEAPDGELSAAFNALASRLERAERAFHSLSRALQRDGDTTVRADLEDARGGWASMAGSLDAVVRDLSRPCLEVGRVLSAVGAGDLSQRMPLELDGRPLRGDFGGIARAVNTFIEQLGRLASEVTRVAHEVGTEGKLGARAQVPGLTGTWKDLTDHVNGMASNLTTQVRGIASVVSAVANGDLSRKLVFEADGEMLELARTVNKMVDQLNAFAGEVTRVAREVGIEGKLGGQARVPGMAGTWLDLTENVNQLADNLTRQVRAMSEVATAVTQGDLTRSITVPAEGELLALKERVNEMIANLRETTQKNREQDWLKSNLARFGALMQGHKSLGSLASQIMSELTPLVGATHGAFFIATEGEGTLQLLSTYAYTERKHLGNRFALGEGIVGQCALEKKSILLTSVPPDYVRISSGLGEGAPRNVLVVPISFEDEVRAVIELASFECFGPSQRALLDQLSVSIGVVLNGIAANARTEALLDQSQLLARELQAQQEELKRSNTELAQQARTLRESEELLKQQQEELQQVNEELEEKANLLAEQNQAVEEKNREVELARAALEEKAEQLSMSARYKSEFLANMSHELRTPLNSLLILARLLADNKERNLSAKQVEYAQTIQSAGSDLLNLINEVLDLSKVEAGKVEIQPAPIEVSEMLDYLERAFRPVAQQKGLSFGVSADPDAPPLITTDCQRLQQILRNLIGNAFKFTETGRVEVRFFRAPVKDVRYEAEALAPAPERVIAFSVSDTGIGIPDEKHQLIFRAFQQADGSTSRKYGGTGLGLSISRELSRLLGGEIRVESAPGQGSTFTLYLPLEVGDHADAADPPSSTRALGPAEVADDRERLSERDRVLLIVESDEAASARLLDVARRHGFKGVITLDGARAVSIARRLRPDAIVLDLELRGTSGLEVLERLKRAVDTRDIPVHVLSDTAHKSEGLRLGAATHLATPATREALDRAFDELSRLLDRSPKSVLVVEDDPVQRRSIAELIARDDVALTAVASAEEALEAVAREHFDCAVLDLGLPGTSGFELIERIRQGPSPELPVIVYTGRDLSQQEETQLKKSAKSIILKDARSPGRLLEETALFLHRVESLLPEHKRALAREAPVRDAALEGKTALIVDDDVRNIFALTTVLEESGMRVLFAENGRDGLRVLTENPDVDLVLMDVMMPEMDGHETMREIRKLPRHEKLPIIALTANAMKGDREKCVDAGASDYVTKPVDPDRLLSLMRVWLYTRGPV